MNSVFSPTKMILFKEFNGLLNNSMELILNKKDIIINNIYNKNTKNIHCNLIGFKNIFTNRIN